VQGTIAVTDYGWYEFLRTRTLSEVNFWTPSDRRSFNAPEFAPFFFKLKAPHNAIGGFGYFARWSSLPDWLAWECFGEGNGCSSLGELRDRIETIRRRIGFVPSEGANNIGCILIVQPTFFPPEMWVPQPTDRPARTVTNKSYDLTKGEGRRVWEACLERAASQSRVVVAPPRAVAEPAARYGAVQLVAPRLGQGTFRVAVTDAYARACAVTNEHSLPALEAAHLCSYSAGGPRDVCNGLLLRADLHRLFDQGYMTLTAEHRLEVSSRLRNEFQNGRTYYPLHGQQVRVPSRPADQPSADFIRWHNDNVYRG
jgi:putative restriction endonuclease